MGNHYSTSNDSGYDSVKVYLRQIGRPPALSRDEESALVSRLRLGDAEAREKLITAHLQLAVSMAFRFRNYRVSLEDLIAEANVGLLQAIDRFDPTRGFRFAACAVWSIRSALWSAIFEKSFIIRIPETARGRWAEFSAASVKLSSLLGREPTLEEIAEATALSVERARQTATMFDRPISLDAPLDEEGHETLADFLEDQSDCAPDSWARLQLLRERVADVLTTLSPRERQILELRFGLNDGKERHLDEIGALYGITHEAIRQCEAKALRRLRHPSRKRLLLDFV